MASRLTADEALLLWVIATTEHADVEIHRSGMGYLEVGIRPHDGDHRLAIVEPDGRVFEWPSTGRPKPWPTNPKTKARLRTMFPAVDRRLRVRHAAAWIYVNDQGVPAP